MRFVAVRETESARDTRGARCARNDRGLADSQSSGRSGQAVEALRLGARAAPRGGHRQRQDRPVLLIVRLVADGRREPGEEALEGLPLLEEPSPAGWQAVSYTHLTLPTIC
eukprot:9389157-Alexandrium_andersonii.AAC.1